MNGPAIRFAPRRAPKAPRRVAVFFALLVGAFTCVFTYMKSVNNPNENVRTFMTMAIVEGHTFKINDLVNRYGWTNDMAAVPEKDGTRSLYSVKAPAASYAGVPFYWALTKIAPHFGHAVATDTSTQEERTWWLRVTTLVVRLGAVQIPCFLFLIWFERWLRFTTDDVVLRLSAVAAAGVGTNYLAYALCFASHAPFAIAAFMSFAITTRERALFPIDVKRRRWTRAFWAGFFAGLATLLEYHALPVSVCLALYGLAAFWRPTRLVPFAVGGLLCAGALMFFQWRAFHDPFMPGHRMSENPQFAAALSKGLFGIEKPSLEVAESISFDLGFGFFGTSPFMLLGFFAIPFALFSGFGTRREKRQRRFATIVWILTMMVLFTTVSAANNWRGGWTVGPRYLGAAPPFFAYGAVCGLERLAGKSRFRRSLVRGIAGGLALASVITIGLVGLHINSIPEDITRPLAQITLPMARAGFVPHLALEMFGVMSPWLWFAVAGAMILATLLAALWPWRDRAWTWGVRFVTFALFAAVGLYPAFTPPPWEFAGDVGHRARRSFVDMWEPQGRDFITTGRENAERLGTRRPCAWIRLAHDEDLVGMEPQATRDEQKSGVKPEQCARWYDRLDFVRAPKMPPPPMVALPPPPPPSPLPMIPRRR